MYRLKMRGKECYYVEKNLSRVGSVARKHRNSCSRRHLPFHVTKTFIKSPSKEGFFYWPRNISIRIIDNFCHTKNLTCHCKQRRFFMFKKLIAVWDLLLANIAIITAGAMMMAM